MRNILSEFAFAEGQRWISQSEAELGLGIIKTVQTRRITVFFPAVGEERTYAANNAPLSRIIYQVGDTIDTEKGEKVKVIQVEQVNGCYFYQGLSQGKEVICHELELSSLIYFNQPQDRLFAGQIDKNRQFSLRLAVLEQQQRLAKTVVKGLIGPRVQLLPHQLYIAHQIGQRVAPRVLLADEVGLGKTIEAGLIIHQQLRLQRAQRVLIIVPDSLIHQWFVELLRRFNLTFSIIDLEKYQAASTAETENPFDSAQCFLCPLSALTASQEMAQAAQDSHWDLLVVDEAHHLKWQVEQSSPEYEVVATLSRLSQGVLLLTATPEQLGMAGHFARLQLLDPKRYYDLEQFEQQESQFAVLNQTIMALMDADIEESDITTKVAGYFSEEEWQSFIDEHGLLMDKTPIIRALLDRYGTGRYLYRNTRKTVSGFPQRRLVPHSLKAPVHYQRQGMDSLKDYLLPERQLGADWPQHDPRVTWLSDWLTHHKTDKALLICADAETAITLEKVLSHQYGKKTTLFHEGMTIINRDRAAAYFADDEAGAQLMICSEIGSEGRNFQFAQHLILFDLPLDPDLLEQRIGRLDRIGQQQTVLVHCPYYEATAQQKLLTWYHQGLNAFETVCAYAGKVKRKLDSELTQCLTDITQDITPLLNKTNKLSEEYNTQLELGRHRLLELHSCDNAIADELIAELETINQPREVAQFMDDIYSEFGILQQVHSQDSILLEKSAEMQEGYFAGLGDDVMTATYYRHRALQREDMAFLNWEHPIVAGAINQICDSELGNTAFCTLQYPALKEGTLLIEAIFTLKIIAPAKLQAERYLSDGYLRVVIDQHGQTHHHILEQSVFQERVGNIPKATKQALVKQAKPIITSLITLAEQETVEAYTTIREKALSTMQHTLQQEQQRLRYLSTVNKAIRLEELDYWNDIELQLSKAITESQIVLDAIRIAIVTQ